VGVWTTGKTVVGTGGARRYKEQRVRMRFLKRALLLVAGLALLTGGVMLDMLGHCGKLSVGSAMAGAVVMFMCISPQPRRPRRFTRGVGCARPE